MLARFFSMQLQMYAEMCLSRQVNAIFSVETEYAYELCVSAMWHPRLPEVLRSHFASLTDNLWLDRHPHFELVVPGYIKRHTMKNFAEQFSLPSFEKFQDDGADPKRKQDFYDVGDPLWMWSCSCNKVKGPASMVVGRVW